MRISTWNINSIRLRLDLVQRLIDQESPDILCFQETKATNDVFPLSFFETNGYAHALIKGMKSYNGVAILSRLPFKDTEWRTWQEKDDCRHAAVTLHNGIEIHNFYVPAGGDIPDPHENPKFAHKLGFLDELVAYWANKERHTPRILLGDLNIAPLENDVWSHKQMTNVVSHTPVEITKLLNAQKAHDFIDAVRHIVPSSQKLYSWWSYRSNDWAKSDKGRRLDHLWVTPHLIRDVKSVKTLKEARGWPEKPSDHVPVLMDI